MKDEKAAELLKRSKIVLDQFMGGHHPSEGQLERLRRAIDACEATRLCGHYVDDDCMCAETPA